MESSSKEKIKKAVKELTLTLIDKEYQQRVWFKFEGPEVDSYTDFICDFFPLLEMMIDKSYGFDLTEKQLSLLKELYKKLNDYEDIAPDYNDEAIVNDPKWDEVRQFTKKKYIRL